MRNTPFANRGWFLLLFLSVLGLVLGCTKDSNSAPDPSPLLEPRPIEAMDTVWLEEMTWMEARDALKAGSTTVIIPTGGVEQNGPYVALGKHNYILQVTCEQIARELGNTLVVPVLKYVPEGSISPPDGHMQFSGTLGVRSETFQMMLIDIAGCLRVHGFKDIILLGDSGGNQADMHFVAQELNGRWSDCRVHYIPEYYDYPKVREWLRGQRVKETLQGYHDEVAFSAQVMVHDPEAIRTSARRKAGLFHINGYNLEPPERTLELGRGIVALRVAQTVKAIRLSLETASL